MCESDELILDIYFMLERDGDQRINDDLIILTKFDWFYEGIRSWRIFNLSEE